VGRKKGDGQGTREKNGCVCPRGIGGVEGVSGGEAVATALVFNHFLFSLRFPQ